MLRGEELPPDGNDESPDDYDIDEPVDVSYNPRFPRRSPIW
jgi:hypothetical protein